jgi:hypothetical protein
LLGDFLQFPVVNCVSPASALGPEDERRKYKQEERTFRWMERNRKMKEKYEVEKGRERKEKEKIESLKT